QVCCSLVGAIDRGGGTSFTHWSTHWPSPFDNHKQTKWVSGLNNSYRDNGQRRIRYGPALNAYFQVSRYVSTRTILYFHGAVDYLQLEESLSFQQASSHVLQSSFQVGSRLKLKDTRGYLSLAVILPGQPRYSTTDFTFKTGATPSVRLLWTNRYLMPWSHLKGLAAIPELTTTVSFQKNFTERQDVYLDDDLQIHTSSAVTAFDQVTPIPFFDLTVSKLLAPPSPFESNRQTRWLGTFYGGVDLSVNRWEWMHLRLSFPLLRWASEADFPEGTEPRTSLSIAIVKTGIFNNQ
ncbi:MAG: hypothetical protein ACE5D2_08805, partial [Fidelibacterota bacterium]